MGHDIYGHKKLADAESYEKKISYLRRSMWSESIHVFYEILGCADLDGGVSGNGEIKEFTKEEFQDAIIKIKTDERIPDEDKNDYINFLKEIIAKEGKFIHFA